MRGKKGIELSVNFLVIMILSLVVFVSGLYFTTKFMMKSTEVKEQLDAETEQQIENMLIDGAKVAIPFDTKTIKKGGSAIFGLGIQNIHKVRHQFIINMSLNSAYDVNGDDLRAEPIIIDNNWILKGSRIFDVDPNKYITVPLLVKVGSRMNSTSAPLRGTYIFNVCVCAIDLDLGENYNDDCSQECTPSTVVRSKLYDGYIHQVFVEVP